MSLSSRQRQLVELFAGTPDGLTADEIARELTVSKRSVYLDLQILRDDLLAASGGTLLHERRGYRLSAEDADAILKQFPDDAPPMTRHLQIIEILAEMRPTSLQDIAQRLYYSKSAIAQELPSVERLLSKFSLSLSKKPRHGTVLVGDELHVRYLLHYCLNEQLEGMSWDLDEMMHARKLLADACDYTISTVLRSHPSRYCLDTLIALMIMYQRVSGGHAFHATDCLKDDIRSNPSLLEEAQSLRQELEEALDVRLSDDEGYYIALYLSAQTSPPESTEQIDSIFDAVKKLVGSKYSEVPIKDDAFFAALLVHVSRMFARIRLGMVMRNPALTYSKEALPLAFNMAADIGMMLQDKFGLPVNEDEVGLLAMHLQAMIDNATFRSREAQRTICIVSHTGYANALMIAARIKKRISTIDTDPLLSFEQMEGLIRENRVPEARLIVSTRTLPGLDSSTYILVSPLISEEELDRINRHLEEASRGQTAPSESNLLARISEKHVLLDPPYRTVEELVSGLSQKLQKDGFVTPEFSESVLSREKMSSTYAVNGVALPHGYSKFVHQQAIAIAILKKPLNWDGSSVDIVFLCALSLGAGTQDRSTFDSLYEIVNDKALLRELHACSSPDEVLLALSNWR